MLNKQPADDLFEQSSMTFGEHLEELRKTLIKSFIWLGIGTVIGLFVADKIVKYIQTPLEKAIYDFHVEQAKTNYKKANGAEPSDELTAMLTKIGRIPQIVYVDPAQLSSQVDGIEDAKSEPVAPASKADSKQIEKESEPNDSDAADEEKLPSATESPAPNTASDSSDSVPDSIVGGELTNTDAWRGVDKASLMRLEPVILWKTIPNKLVSLEATEPFMVWLKAGLVAGCIIGSPGIFWHIWQFFAAGLYPHERRYVYWYLPLSLLLFLAGVSLAFFLVFRLVLGFLIGYSADLDVEFMPRLNTFMSFALFLPLGFGIAFQLPLVMLGLHRFGVVSVVTFVSQWRIAVLAIAFLSMVLTPAEIYSMVGLFIPLTGLYFLGIGLCRWMPRGAGVGGLAEDPHD